MSGSFIFARIARLQRMLLGACALTLAAHPVARAQPNYLPYHFTTLAGTASVAGGAGDGPAATATFRSPRGIAVSRTGNVFVADSGNYAIRKIATDGMVTTYAGILGTRGTTDGYTGTIPGITTATYNGPVGLAFDFQDSLFVTDVSNLRWLAPPQGGSNPAPSTFTIAYGSVYGLIRPEGVTTDAVGDVYFTDRLRNTLHKFSSFRPSPLGLLPGALVTLANTTGTNGYLDGPAATAWFNAPGGIALDVNHTIYVADSGNHVIRKVTASGIVSTVAGHPRESGAQDGPGAAAGFNTPGGVAVDPQGNIFVADTFNHTIRRITATGLVQTLAGSPGVPGSSDGTGAQARFNGPWAIAIDSQGVLYVADYLNNIIRRGAPNRAPLATDGAATTATDQPVAFTLAASDPDGGTLTYALGTATNGTAILIGNQVVFTPAAGFSGTGTVTFAASDGYAASETRTISITVVAPVPFLVQPVSRSTAAGGTVAFGANANAGSYQWQVNGRNLAGANSTSLTVANIQPADTGIYAVVCSNLGGTSTSEPAILGLMTSAKTLGAGRELAPVDILHPNGNYFDQVLLEGAAASITADSDQITRISFVDLDNDIVQVELAGPGTLSITLDNASGPAPPANYNQAVNYMKGHAGIVVAGAMENTYLSIFSVGRSTAYDPTGAFNFLGPINSINQPANNGSSLFQGRNATVYGGTADIAFVAILSANGKFGGLRTANTNYFSTKGITGLYAPGVEIIGPVYLGNITAFDAATPVLMVGSNSDARITGGDLAQSNLRPVQVSGLDELRFTAGGDSHGRTFPAKRNQARLVENGVDVTTRIVINPP